MIIYPRKYDIAKLIERNKALIIYGPRRVGKTTMLRQFLAGTKLKYRLENGDNTRVQQVLSSKDFEQIKDFVQGYDLIAIDEAQQIPDIGLALKIIVDNIEDIYLIATGSSSFELSQTIGEPLTGRKKTVILYPLSQEELRLQYNKGELREKLEEFLIFGSYPGILSLEDRQGKRTALNELAESYLLRDILKLDNIRFSQKLLNLLKLLAFQIGNLVSINELANQSGLNRRTVERYLDLLEKGFVIKRLGGLSRNLRNEINNKAKYYFLDNGIRNAIISNFNPLDKRDDVGALFENFIVIERLKNSQSLNNYYFWRNYVGKEIDLIEEESGTIKAYEIKWRKQNVAPPDEFLRAYTGSQFAVVNQDNYLDFVLGKDS